MLKSDEPDLKMCVQNLAVPYLVTGAKNYLFSTFFDDFATER